MFGRALHTPAFEETVEVKVVRATTSVTQWWSYLTSLTLSCQALSSMVMCVIVGLLMWLWWAFLSLPPFTFLILRFVQQQEKNTLAFHSAVTYVTKWWSYLALLALSCRDLSFKAVCVIVGLPIWLWWPFISIPLFSFLVLRFLQ